VYHYAGNNPVKYVDPDGEIILPVTSFALQNSSDNKDLDMGPGRTFYGNKPNTVGNYGCLFTAVVNVGNTIRRKTSVPSSYAENQLSSLAGLGKYFITKEVAKGTDIFMSTKTINLLLKDMTGKDMDVARVRDKTAAQVLLKFFTNSTSKAYFIAEVNAQSGGSHFINVSGVDSEGNLLVHDPYNYQSGPKSYTINDVVGLFVISEKYHER
jgi:hypothetical protein